MYMLNNNPQQSRTFLVLTIAVTLMSILRVELLTTCNNLIFHTPPNIAIFIAMCISQHICSWYIDRYEVFLFVIISGLHLPNHHFQKT